MIPCDHRAATKEDDDGVMWIDLGRKGRGWDPGKENESSNDSSEPTGLGPGTEVAPGSAWRSCANSPS